MKETSTTVATRRRRTAPPIPDADVLFLGDLCFGASYGRRAFERRGFDSAFERIDALLKHSNFVIANLETTLTRQEVSPLEGKKRYVHKDDPEGANALCRHGIDAVSLANNHAFDYGAAGLNETLKSLGEAGITAIGAGILGQENNHSLVRNLALKQNTFRLAVTVGKEHVEYAYPYYAGQDEAGINGWVRRSAAAQIRALRKDERSAFIVAFPHWGKNYRWKRKSQYRLARSMIRAGADLVVGHGAHCVQEIERVEGRWVVYSIGNSVFNTRGGFRSRPEILPYSFLARLCVRERRSGSGPSVTLRLYPILSDNRRTNFRPRFVKRSELTEIRTELIKRSDEPAALEEALKRGKDDFGRFLKLPIRSDDSTV